MGVLFKKRNWKYLFTVIIVLKNGKKLPFFKFADHRTEGSNGIIGIIAQRTVITDNASIEIGLKKFVTGKSSDKFS